MSLPPLIAGISDLPDSASDCGCCNGVSPQTPGTIYNRPALPVVRYRPGSWASFNASQLSRLSAEENPALSRLRAREEDFSIALIDAWSCTCDVLSFYQERNANEAWLGTALERESLIELGRLIGYRLRPGVAAAADLVFLLDQPPGVPPPVAAVTIPARSRVQSVPGPDETAQTFETVDAIDARVDWNALKPRQTVSRVPANGQIHTWVKGVSTGLKDGDVILIAGAGRVAGDVSSQWDVRRLTKVTPEPAHDRTKLEWSPALDSVATPAGSAPGHHIFTFRARASLFGWNAPHPNLLSDAARTRYSIVNTNDWTFTLDAAASQLHLDTIQERFVAGSWVAITTPSNIVTLSRVGDAVDDGRADYAVSARVTRLTLDSQSGLAAFVGASYRKTSVYGASEELAFADAPNIVPIFANVVELDAPVEGLFKGQRLVLRGRRAQLLTARDGLVLVPDAVGAQDIALPLSSRVTLIGLPRPEGQGSSNLVWPVRSSGGVDGTVTTSGFAFAFVEADSSADIVSEIAVLRESRKSDDTHQLLTFETMLAAIFDRASTRIHGNVAAATHGETTQEVLGNGDASKPFTALRLKQAPLTHVSAATESGALSTLELRVNDILWHEAPTLYGQSATATLYETRIQDDGSAVVQFGDGIAGARPSTGRNNIVATYRKGIGVAGSVAAGTLTTAIDRPLGLKEIFNPLPASGGQDAETLATARSAAPVTTLTLGRVVSLQNYEDFARGFAGIAKARANMIWDGDARRIVVTVAGPGGAPVDPASSVYTNLVAALRSLGDPFVRITLLSYRAATFKLKARIKVHSDYLAETVLAAIEATLRERYSFDVRGFATLIASSDVISSIQAVEGVEAVDLDRLHRTTGVGSLPILHHRLLAAPVVLDANGALSAAEILSLDPAPVQLEVMS
jgi:hypothetical protein